MIIPYHIYRHFKGGLYLVLAVALSEENYEPTVVYMSLNGDGKVWTRSQTEFTSPVPDDRPNPTGQKNRFELVNDVKSVLSNCTTDSLIRELKSRPDNPFNEVDFEGLNDRVKLREYTVGELKNSPIDEGVYLEPVVTVDTLEEAKQFIERHPDRCSLRTKIFKGVIIEVESFD